MITIRETQETDVDLLCEIQKEAFAPLYERYHDPSNPCLRGREDIANRLNNPTFRYFTIEVDGEQVTLVDNSGNRVNVVSTDVDASNGVIHVLDAVLLPTL